MARHKRKSSRRRRRSYRRRGARRTGRKALVIRCRGSRISARRMKV